MQTYNQFKFLYLIVLQKINLNYKQTSLNFKNQVITEREGVRNLIMGQYGMKWDKMGRFFGNKDVS